MSPGVSARLEVLALGKGTYCYFPKWYNPPPSLCDLGTEVSNWTHGTLGSQLDSKGWERGRQ